MVAEDGLGIGLRVFHCQTLPPAFLSRPLRGHPPPGGGNFSPRWGEGKNAKNPPFPEKRGISITICSTLYAERILATSRAVLLDCRQAESVSLAFAPGQARYAERKLATGRAVQLDGKFARSEDPNLAPGTAGLPVGRFYSTFVK